jgi:hypothetical protein
MLHSSADESPSGATSYFDWPDNGDDRVMSADTLFLAGSTGAMQASTGTVWQTWNPRVREGWLSDGDITLIHRLDRQQMDRLGMDRFSRKPITE